MDLARRVTQEAGPDAQVEEDAIMVEAARSLPDRDGRRIYGLGSLAAAFELVADPPIPEDADRPEHAAAGEARGAARRRLEEEVAELQGRVDQRDARQRALEDRLATMEAEIAELRRHCGPAGPPPPPADAEDLGRDD